MYTFLSPKAERLFVFIFKSIILRWQVPHKYACTKMSALFLFNFYLVLRSQYKMSTFAVYVSALLLSAAQDKIASCIYNGWDHVHVLINITHLYIVPICPVLSPPKWVFNCVELRIYSSFMPTKTFFHKSSNLLKVFHNASISTLTHALQLHYVMSNIIQTCVVCVGKRRFLSSYAKQNKRYIVTIYQ